MRFGMFQRTNRKGLFRHSVLSFFFPAKNAFFPGWKSRLFDPIIYKQSPPYVDFLTLYTT